MNFVPKEEVQPSKEQLSWLDRPLLPLLSSIKIETILITLILILAVFSRFYILGARVMSHDETNHVVPSWELYQGQGYVHDPITHGPLQFHLIALTFFLFGDSDFTARIPAALFSIATVAFAWWGFRRYFGRTGALVSSFLMLISPYMLFYGRYVRNEAFIALFGLVTLFAMLRYLETGQNRYIFLLTTVTILNFTAKETAYIYTAQALLFLGVLFLVRVSKKDWNNPSRMRPFMVALAAGIVLLVGAIGVHVMAQPTGAGTATAVAAPSTVATPPAAATGLPPSPIAAGLAVLGVISLIAAGYFLVTGLTWKSIRSERSFDLLILLGTLVLPLLTAFPVNLVGWNPQDYSNTGILHTSLFLIPMTLIAIGIGVWWRPRLWLQNAAIFYGIFTFFFTTFFTNGPGFFTGMVGSLGYWLAQQGVDRGSQPLYYYALIQIPMYEYLPAIGTLVAIYLAFRGRFPISVPEQPAVEAEPLAAEMVEVGDGVIGSNGHADGQDELVAEDAENPIDLEPPSEPQEVPFVALLLYWVFTALVAYSIAGEKMPWLTVHIALPMIIAAGWAFGHLIDTAPWKTWLQKRGLLALLLLPVFFFSLLGVLSSLLGTQPPFQGKDLVQLESTASFLIALIVLVASGAGLLRIMRTWAVAHTAGAFGMVFLALLTVQTVRTSIRSSYINYDNAKEFLVYAHAAAGDKQILAQVQEISQRITGGLDIAVAYDNEALYPFWWYLRDYPNKVYFADNPTTDLRNDPIIIVGDTNYNKIAPIVGNNYDYYQTTRLWWPMQDYFNLTWNRIAYALTNPAIRAGIWDIWLNANYTQYAKATDNQNLTLTTWQPSNSIRIYIRKDIVAKIWNYGVSPTTQATTVDPYAKGTIQLNADQIVGSQGTQPGQFQSPRAVAVAPDGSLYVADSGNNRIEHLSADGKVLQVWGSFADISKGAAPGGTFNEPWGVAVGPDGSVYVADTWNNRIQKFTATGQFVKMWGYFGTAEKPDAFWGPRGVAVNAQGQVFVTDTGNKRVVVFDANGNFITQFGGGGAQPGQMDEPVGIAVDSSGNVYVADTWNQRVEVFAPDASGTSYSYLRTWSIDGWFGQSLDNKPYLAVDGQGHVFVTDPEGYRILEFTTQGDFVRAWGTYSTGADGFGLAAGVAVDSQGNIWATDAGNNRLMHFTLPKP